MKIQLSILFLLIIQLTVYGQHNLGLKVNGGISRISTNLNSTLTKQKIQFTPSGHGGLFYNFRFRNKSILGTELLFIQIEGKERMETDATDEYGNPTGELIIDDVWRHISYLGLPIFYGFRIKKLTIDIGFQVSLTLSSSGREKGQAPDNGNVITWDNEFDELNIDNYDYGPRAGIIFNLTEKFAIEGAYYYGINNILNDVINWTWRVQQVTIGFRYTFLTTTNNENE